MRGLLVTTLHSLLLLLRPMLRGYFLDHLGDLETLFHAFADLFFEMFLLHVIILNRNNLLPEAIISSTHHVGVV